MPRGDKSAYTDKQKRQARHIEKSIEDRGTSRATAERVAWATVNKLDGGGLKKTSSKKKSSKKRSSRSSARTRPTAKKSTGR